MNTTSCRNCLHYVALAPLEGTTATFVAVDLAQDGFTPTTARHICGESDRRALKAGA